MTINIPTMKNWMTTLGGILAGLPPLILTSFMSAGIPLSPKWTAIMSVIGGLGALLIGLAAKDATTHSTAAEVAKATEEAAPTPRNGG